MEEERYSFSAVWTGKEMIVFGGHDTCYYASCDCWSYCPHGDGYAYDPRTKTWRALSTGTNEWKALDLKDYLPTSRGDHTAVWAPKGSLPASGGEMLVFGGLGGPTQDFWMCWLGRGEAYGAETDSWRYMSKTNEPRWRFLHTALWSSATKEMLVWGGESQSSQCANDVIYLSDGGAYHPLTDEWRSLSLVNAPAGRTYHSGVWAEEVQKAAVWGGGNSLIPVLYVDGGRYDPALDEWTPIPKAPIEPRAFHTAVWADTVNEMIVWGGQGWDEFYNLVYFNDGAHYNPATDAWAKTFVTPNRRWTFGTPVWTGSEMIVQRFHYVIDGATNSPGFHYNPATEQSLLAALDPFDYRIFHTAVWTGMEVIYFGGPECDADCRSSGCCATYPFDGAAYRAPGWYYADQTGDDRVDGEDLAAMSRAFGCAKGEACYEKKADIYGRDWDGGLVDATDLFLFTEVFGQRKPAGCMQ